MADSEGTIKLTFKDLKQQKFQIEAKPSNTIAEVKDMIAKEKGWDVSLQKLIYSGKILQDKNTVESYKIEEKGFIVCMVSKPKPAGGTSTPGSTSSAAAAAPSTPVKSPSTPAPAPAAPAQPPPAPSGSTASTGATVPETPTPAGQTATSQTASFNDPSALAMGAGRESAITQIVEMGFPRPDVERAMRAAYNNPDRAMEYLLNGIPDHLQQEAAGGGQQRQAAQRPQAAAQPAAAAAAAAAPAASSGGSAAPADESAENVNLFEAAAARAAGGNRGAAGGGAAAAAAAGAGAGAGANLDFLRNNEQFQQLRQVIQQQPQMLEPILQQVGSGNPQLAQLINSNPDAFLQLLAEQGDDDEALPPGATAINVTPEERDAIERLCQLGFSRDDVIQAYFACDKNEELAANFLFEQGNDMDQD